MPYPGYRTVKVYLTENSRVSDLSVSLIISNQSSPLDAPHDITIELLHYIVSPTHCLTPLVQTILFQSALLTLFLLNLYHQNKGLLNNSGVLTFIL
jgi:hypothetical protein